MAGLNMSLPDAKNQHPSILVFAGPNGSGKSTITKGLPTIGIYVNADDIKRQSHCSDLEAAQEAEEIRRLLVASGSDFTFETVLSTSRNLNFLADAKKKGYEIFAVFVLTSDSQINVDRVQARVKAGGHAVPKDKILSRYKKSLSNLSQLVHIADHTRIIDNSGDTPELICEIDNLTAAIFPSNYWTQEAILRLLTEPSQ